MTFNDRLAEIDRKIRNMKIDGVEEELLSLVQEEEAKIKQDDNEIKLSFNNYAEVVIYVKKFNPTKKLVPLEDNIGQAYFLLGYVSFDQNDFEKAIKYLDIAAKWNPVSPKIKLEKADAIIKLGKKEEFKKIIDESYEYIYDSIFLSKYYRELGWYYAENKEYDLANALYSHSANYWHNHMVDSELRYIAQQEKRPLRVSTKEEIKQLLGEKNIPLDFSKEITQMLYDESQQLLNEKNYRMVHNLYRVLYDITLNKRFMLYLTIKNKELGIQFDMPEKWKIINKEEYEKYGIKRDFLYVLTNTRNLHTRIMHKGECAPSMLQEMFDMHIQDMKEQGLIIEKTFDITSNDKQRVIYQVIAKIKEKDDKEFRVCHNFVVANDQLFIVSWNLPAKEDLEKMVELTKGSFNMKVVFSFRDLEEDDEVE